MRDAGRERLWLAAGSWEKAARARGELERERGWRWSPPPPPFLLHGRSGDGVTGLLWLPWLGAGAGPALGRTLSHECRVSSWLGVSSPRWPASPSPAHKGAGDHDASHPRVWGGGTRWVPVPLCTGGWGPPWHLSPASSCRRMGSPGSMRAPISPAHLQTEPSRQKAASSPAQWLLSSPGCGNKGPFVGARVPRGRALASSPLRWAPASPPPGGGVPPASPIRMGGRGWADSGARHFGKRGPGRGAEGTARGRERGWAVPVWRWGALLRGQGSSGHGVDRWRAATTNFHRSPSPVHLSAAARWGDAALERGGAQLGDTWPQPQVFIQRCQVARWRLAIPRSHRKSIGKEGWVFQEICVSPLQVTPLQSCTDPRCSRLCF